jgi:glycosyltransferase involved in cell wall biosynthesis
MHVSIIIPYYNKKKTIFQTLDSLNNQIYNDFEVIIVDDGSDEKISNFLDITVYKFPIRLLYQTNKGLSSARNLGLKNFKGDLISFLDADDVWMPEKLLEQVINSKKFEFIYANYLTFSDDKIMPIVNNFKIGTNNLTLELLKGNCIHGSASSVLISRTLFEKVGFFNEKLVYAEDWDYWLRCFMFTNNILFIDKPLVKIRSNNIDGKYVTNHEISFSINDKINSIKIIFDNLIDLNNIYKKYIHKNIITYKALHMTSFGFFNFITIKIYYNNCFYFLRNSYFNEFLIYNKFIYILLLKRFRIKFI